MADQKFDVHAHFIPPCYRKTLLDNGYTNPDGMLGIPEWTIKSHLAYMDSVGIAKSILGISSLGTHLNSDTATIKTLTREINKYAANVKRQCPARFGFFASLPLPDIAASVEEILYALDTLDADDFVLHSNTAGIYLGDPVLRRVLAELDARRAVVFIHPTAACHRSHKHDSLSERYLTSSPLSTPLPRPALRILLRQRPLPLRPPAQSSASPTSTS